MSTSSAQPNAADRRRLWFGLLGGAVAWLAHLLLAWSISEFGCLAGLGQPALLGLSGTAWLVIFVSAATFAGSVAATIAARFMHKRLQRRHTAQEIGTDLFFARVGVITSGLFAFVILVETIPVFFFLRSC